VAHFDNFMYDAELVVASHHKDNIERRSKNGTVIVN